MPMMVQPQEEFNNHKWWDKKLLCSCRAK